MDKRWMRAPRSTHEYREGVKKFLDFAFSKTAEHNRILCPCKYCRNAYWFGREEVSDHLGSDGFMAGYTSWIHHGEGLWSSDPGVTSSSQCEHGNPNTDEIDRMLMEGFGMYDASALGEDEGLKDELDTETYYKLVNDASTELYPGCKFSNLQFLVRILNIKNIGGVSDDCFNELLSLIKDALPDGVDLPKNFHDAKKFVKAIGVSYECIDACPNDCILYRKQYADAKSCPVCHTSRWKSEKIGLDGKRVHRVPQKVVRHFPLKKRLQRLFMSSKTAPLMRWHKEGRTKDGFLRHPADSPAWKHFDAVHKEFSSETRNVRLGLAADGFNPFGRMNASYSIWPIFLIPYNLPPWMCMKQSHFILSVLIPGKRSPGKDMDVYLQLTIDDLLECWNKGFMTYDVSSSEKFLLRAALLWTISDWIGRGCLSGESLSACSHCLIDTCSLRLKHGNKTCYRGRMSQGRMSQKRKRDSEDNDRLTEINVPARIKEMKLEWDKESEMNGITDAESDSEEESETELDEDHEDQNNIDGMEESGEKKKGKRGPTRMESLWKDRDADNKINLKFNRFGQPCGLKTCKLTNFIGTLVKGKEISLAATNWSKVAKCDKEKLWQTVQAFFNVDESFKPWVLRSASKKWKDFKAVLKRTYYNPNLTRQQNVRNGCGKRIPDPQWKWLVQYWKTSTSKAKSEKNKAIRGMQLNGTHTTGSRSFAVTLDQLEMKEGRQVGRAELYIVTHTKRNGDPVDKYSGDNINEIKRQLAANPSLVGEEARDGDVFSGLFPKERSGRWRGLGLLVGGRASKELAEVKAELQETKNENLRLWSVIQALEKSQSALHEQQNELKDMLLASQRQHKPVDNDQKIMPEAIDPLEDIETMDIQDKEAPTSTTVSRSSKVKTKKLQCINKKGQPTQQREKSPPSLQLQGKTILMDKDQHKKPRKFQTPLQKGEFAVLKRGLEVGLISPHSGMVAFATVQAADSKAKATDGQPLADCVEVLINTVFSKTTLLPRSQGNINKLASAVGKCIPWPRKNLEPLDDGSGSVVPPTAKVSSAACITSVGKGNPVKRKKVVTSSS